MEARGRTWRDHCAADADELMAKVRSVRPDLVITDIRMPPTNTTDGLDAARRIREELPAIGVLVLSRYVEASHALKLVEGAPDRVGYLLKDRVSDVSEFADAVCRVETSAVTTAPDAEGMGKFVRLDDPKGHRIELWQHLYVPVAG